jgi:hypothetical protein
MLHWRRRPHDRKVQRIPLAMLIYIKNHLACKEVAKAASAVSRDPRGRTPNKREIPAQPSTI